MVVQRYGPIETNGSLLLSGMTEMGGESWPRDEGDAVDEVRLGETEEIAEPVLVLRLSGD